jgi:hypothetical protein
MKAAVLEEATPVLDGGKLGSCSVASTRGTVARGGRGKARCGGAAAGVGARSSLQDVWLFGFDLGAGAGGFGVTRARQAERAAKTPW